MLIDPVISTEDAPVVLGIAKEFCNVLREWLTPDEMETVINRNRKQGKSWICHSHDFCDANMAMYDAFLNLGIKASVDYEEEEIAGRDHATDLWNAAWDIAKHAEFNADKCLSSL